MAEARYLISDAAKKVDVESHVLRYWEDELELKIPRNDMGHRYYTDYYIRLFQRVKELKEKGYQLKAIKGVLERLNRTGDDISITEEDMEKEMRKTWMSNVIVDNRMNHEELLGQIGRAEEKAGSSGEHGKEGAYDQMESVKKTSLANEEKNPKKAEVRGQEEKECEVENRSEITPVDAGVDKPSAAATQEKLQQLQMLFNHMVGQAMDAKLERLEKDLTEGIGETVSHTVGDMVTDRVMREVEYLMRVSDEKDEERYRQLDATIRSTQKNGKGHAEAAATKLPFFRKKRFGKSGKKLF